MKHIRYAQPTITCPICSLQQTGIIRQLKDNLYIQCLRCEHVTHGPELDNILTPIIKAPGDIREIPNYTDHLLTLNEVSV